jgi:hypothetical protein
MKGGFCMARVAVGGSRSIESYELIQGVLKYLLIDGDVVLSGNAPGADRLGERYAGEAGLEWRGAAQVSRFRDKFLGWTV